MNGVIAMYCTGALNCRELVGGLAQRRPKFFWGTPKQSPITIGLSLDTPVSDQGPLKSSTSINDDRRTFSVFKIQQIMYP